MLLNLEWLKAEHERLMEASANDTNLGWVKLCMGFYDLGFKLGEYNGKLSLIDDLITEMERQPHEQELSHAHDNGSGAIRD